jgi:two-component system cell cycle response regulator DivK
LIKPKILIADDDADNREIAKDALELAGYDVVIAVDGEETLEKIAAERPDVVLLDLSMPKVDGWEVARRVRANPNLPHVPIIAFTAHALVGEELKAKSAGCDDFLTKPCVPKAIIERVTHWLKTAHAGAPEAP